MKSHAARQSIEDQELVACFLENFDKGFSRMVKIHQSTLYGVALNVLNNRHLAQDAVQDSLCKAYAYLSDWNMYNKRKIQTMCFRAWLCRVTYTTTLDLYYAETQFWRADTLEKAELMERQGHRFVQPGANVVDMERRQKIQEAWKKLPPLQSEVLRLRFFQNEEVAAREMKLREIAEKLGIPENTVKSHMRRGIRRLRKLLVEYKRKVA